MGKKDKSTNITDFLTLHYLGVGINTDLFT